MNDIPYTFSRLGPLDDNRLERRWRVWVDSLSPPPLWFPPSPAFVRDTLAVEKAGEASIRSKERCARETSDIPRAFHFLEGLERRELGARCAVVDRTFACLRYALVGPFNYPQFPAAVFDQKLNRKSLLWWLVKMSIHGQSFLALGGHLISRNRIWFVVEHQIRGGGAHV